MELTADESITEVKELQPTKACEPMDAVSPLETGAVNTTETNDWD